MSNRTKIILLFLFLFAFRTLFGMSLTFFGSNEIENDSLQTYLIGLKCYTTGTWPYFGPDQYRLDLGFRSQMPGALEGLAVGLPFYLLPIPEAPFLFLNLLSLGAIGLLAWYITRRLPELSFPFVLAWTALLPWTLNRSTNVLNPSYTLFGSVLFFIGFLESLPGLSLKKLPPAWAFALMGFGLCWDMQFHGSWVLLPILPVVAFLWRRQKKEHGMVKEMGGFLGGAAGPLALLLPTLIQFGFDRGTSGVLHVASGFNWENFKPLTFFTILARYLSLGCYEMPRFIGSGTGERTEFLSKAKWLIPPATFLTLTGWLQPLAMLFAWVFLILITWLQRFGIFIGGWLKDRKHKDALAIQTITFLSFFWIWFSFWFTNTGPASHMYYLFLPLVVVCWFYFWSRLDGQKGWRWFGAACLAASLWFQIGFVLHPRMQAQSVFSHRDRIVKALEQKDYRVLAERRPQSLY